MKKTWRIVATAIFVVLVFVSVLIYRGERKIVVYKENEEKIIKAKDIKNFLADGWSEDRTFLIYSIDGEEKYVTESQFSDYDKEKWGREPYVTLYALSGETVSAPQSMVEEYLSVGWLRERVEWEGLSELREEIEAYLATQRGKWGVFVQNLENLEYMVVGEDKYTSASLVKLYTMATTYSEIEKGSIEKNENTKSLLNSMITVSSNEACNSLTRMNGSGKDSVGYDRENELCQNLGCTNTARGSYLVDQTGKRGTYRHHNYTSPRDCGRLLRAIYEKTLISEEASEEILDLLLKQTRRWKIPQSLPENTKVANKTGETDDVNSDVAIVFSEGAPYIICVLGNGKGLGVEPIHAVSKMTYSYFNK